MAPRSAGTGGRRRLAVLAAVLHSGCGSAAAAAAAVPDCHACTELDRFDEALHLRALPFTHDPPLTLARFEFEVTAQLSPAFRADQFDVFPKPIGKLLNAHPQISAFEATLTRGRWKDEEWGPDPRESSKPPGALLVAALNATDGPAADESWKFLISALSGSLCASFEGMDPEHDASHWVKPMDVPWAEPGMQARFATLPYEPVCTENLTPWRKLLPCGAHRGFAALLAPIAVAESPLVSLSLAAARQSSGLVTLRAGLEVVLPHRPGWRGYAAWFGDRAFAACAAADSSAVLLAGGLQAEGEEEGAEQGGGAVLTFAADRFANVTVAVTPDPGVPAPWLAKESLRADGLSVMRDMLSREGYSERTHGRYLLRISNEGLARRVRFMDQLPFFIRPLWHTFHVSIQLPGGPMLELAGAEAMRRIQLQFVPTDGLLRPTEVFLQVDVRPGETVSVFLNVQKNFLQLREFSYACEKGFDVGSAAWMELDLSEGASAKGSDLIRGDDIVALLAAKAPGGAWRLRFTEGILVLVPMPDFSMPFNVIALCSTAVTFFFGSLFRMTAAGKLRHWVLKRDDPLKRSALSRLAPMLVFGSLAALAVVEPAQLVDLRAQLPEDLAPVVDLLESAKRTMQDLHLSLQ